MLCLPICFLFLPLILLISVVIGVFDGGEDVVAFCCVCCSVDLSHLIVWPGVVCVWCCLVFVVIVVCFVCVFFCCVCCLCLCVYRLCVVIVACFVLDMCCC